jgi:hypothetical protein
VDHRGVGFVFLVFPINPSLSTRHTQFRSNLFCVYFDFYFTVSKMTDEASKCAVYSTTKPNCKNANTLLAPQNVDAEIKTEESQQKTYASIIKSNPAYNDGK